MLTIEKMRKHVEQLAEQFQVTWECHNDTKDKVNYSDAEGWTQTLLRLMYIPCVVDEKSYAIALHELGHIATTPALQLNKYNADTYFAEREAWDWAQANAIEWTPDMQTMQNRGLASYFNLLSRR